MNAFCPVVFPSASSTNVSSDRMIVTSCLSPSDFASPFFTVHVFFKSIVHHASFPSAFLTLNSKMPLFCEVPPRREQFKNGQISRSGARTFFSCAAFSSALYPSKTAASAARISDVWGRKIRLRSKQWNKTAYLVSFNFDVGHYVLLRETGQLKCGDEESQVLIYKQNHQHVISYSRSSLTPREHNRSKEGSS